MNTKLKPQPATLDPQEEAIRSLYLESLHLVERLHRRLLDVIKDEFERALAKCDVILGPTSPIPAFEIGGMKDPLSMYLCDVYTVNTNIAGIPGISFNAGWAEEGGRRLPIGLQLVGPMFGDALVLRLATPAGAPLIRVVQPNIGQDEKYSAELEQVHFRTLATLSGKPRPAPRQTPKAGRALQGLIKELDGKFGRGATALEPRWREIVGDRLARVTRPQKLTRGRGGAGGTLELRVAGPAALLVQHQSEDILARVNLFLGAGTVDRLRIAQGPVAPLKEAAARPKRSAKPPPLPAGGGGGASCSGRNCPPRVWPADLVETAGTARQPRPSVALKLRCHRLAAPAQRPGPDRGKSRQTAHHRPETSRHSPAARPASWKRRYRPADRRR